MRRGTEDLAQLLGGSHELRALLRGQSVGRWWGEWKDDLGGEGHGLEFEQIMSREGGDGTGDEETDTSARSCSFVPRQEAPEIQEEWFILELGHFGIHIPEEQKDS